jgi:hypothetical protein
MSNLTEAMLLTDYIANTRKPEDNEWYDRVYLCYEDTDFKMPNNYLPIKGFNCYRYNSFASADYAWNNHRETEQKLEVRHTMIPMCKWVPEMFDRYILKWKLRNMYWLGKISYGRGYNRYSQTSSSKDN